jgi:hypothetical protein
MTNKEEFNRRILNGLCPICAKPVYYISGADELEPSRRIEHEGREIRICLTHKEIKAC